MPFTESDLRAVLRDRSSDGAPGGDVLDAVHAAVRRHTRRSRLATAIAATAAPSSPADCSGAPRTVD